jgi:hypothetical protein
MRAHRPGTLPWQGPQPLRRFGPEEGRMVERLYLLVVYVGSAAMVAFMAACLSSPQDATFSCHTSGANGAQRCEIIAPDVTLDSLTAEQPPQETEATEAAP